MESALGEQRALQPYHSSSACDACHSRKVRCDRNYPCGNCQDQGTTCTHHRRRRRLPKRPAHPTERKAKVSHENRSPSKALLEVWGSLQGLAAEEVGDSGVGGVLCEKNFNLPAQVLEQHVLGGSNIMNKLHSWISLIPLTDAQLGNQRHLECLGNLAWTKRRAIESALYVARQALNRVKGLENLLDNGGNAGEHRNVPSVEFLAWIVKDVGSDRFGSYVLDYFKHVSMSTLKRMGLSLIHNDTSSFDSILFTVCVNAVACKFLTTLLMADDYGELSREIRIKASQYRTLAQRALKNIRLLTAPSLALLQALLCGVFLHQQSGDTQLCSELTQTACRVCVDLCLPDAVNQQQATEEEYYCVMWCYMLDRSYAWKQGRSLCFLNVNTRANKRDSLPNNHPVSELLQIYMSLAQVQESIIPFLGDFSSSHGEDFPSFYLVREQLTPKMEDIRSAIEQIASPSPKWRGLDVHSEVAALNFAYHSVMTTIFHLSQVISNQHLEAGELYLQSARQELLALISMCLSSDNDKTAAFLHWTLLYWPLTACFVLFCNAVATSDLGDFTLLKTAANCLLASSTISRPVATLQQLFQELVSLSQAFVTESTSVAFADERAVQLRLAQLQGTTSQSISAAQTCTNSGDTWVQDINQVTSNHDTDPSALMLYDIFSLGDLNIVLGASADPRSFGSF